MSEFSKPIFTPDELNEEKTGICIDYNPESLVFHDFRKPITNKLKQATMLIKEKINGLKKRCQAQSEINKFGWTRFEKDDNALYFGIKFSPNASMGVTQIGRSALRKYHQLLKYYLHMAGWKNISTAEFGEYTIKLDNIENIDNFYALSPYIGFYCKSAVPDPEYLDKCKAALLYHSNTRKLNTFKNYESR